ADLGKQLPARQREVEPAEPDRRLGLGLGLRISVDGYPSGAAVSGLHSPGPKDLRSEPQDGNTSIDLFPGDR
ncbi:hypothetical protein ABT352_17455, partial [Streptosporangium sp. NPDC000563]|uniref:hypothetical protein n=1 Tax=Streptosporangium sp. NPDC000563 TaxID=3154366 RepID=UPI003323B539